MRALGLCSCVVGGGRGEERSALALLFAREGRGGWGGVVYRSTARAMNIIMFVFPTV